MLRGDIVNYLVARFDYKSYLEIGIDNGRNYNRVRCDNKVGVEPDSKKCSFNSIINQTSDEYFSKLNDTVKFDIIFIDGDHHEEQVDKDIKNSLDHLNSGGIIVMHDCNPPRRCIMLEKMDLISLLPPGESGMALCGNHLSS